MVFVRNIAITGVMIHSSNSIEIHMRLPIMLFMNIIVTNVSPENTICVLESGKAKIVTISIISAEHIYIQKLHTD